MLATYRYSPKFSCYFLTFTYQIPFLKIRSKASHVFIQEVDQFFCIYLSFKFSGVL